MVCNHREKFLPPRFAPKNQRGTVRRCYQCTSCAGLEVPPL